MGRKSDLLWRSCWFIRYIFSNALDSMSPFEELSEKYGLNLFIESFIFNEKRKTLSDRLPFSVLSATVSARMSGIGNASIHRLYRSMIVKQKQNPSADEQTQNMSKLEPNIGSFSNFREELYGKKESLLTSRQFLVPLEDFGKKNMPGKRARRHFSQLIEFERGLVKGMKTAGWSTHRVAGQVNRSECAVRNCWEQWTRGGTHVWKTGSGATKKTTRRED
ncbi:transposable element Tcb2 transposase [Trichonephila clavipes]|nr:transposable element Tcb2 transposase [Trichonephila clavipes]